jgi:hypothetical protein
MVAGINELERPVSPRSLRGGGARQENQNLLGFAPAPLDVRRLRSTVLPWPTAKKPKSVSRLHAGRRQDAIGHGFREISPSAAAGGGGGGGGTSES